MINTNIVNMLSAINERSILVLEMVVNASWETSDFDDLEALDALYQVGWIDGVCQDDECRWIMTEKGRGLYGVLSGLVV